MMKFGRSNNHHFYSTLFLLLILSASSSALTSDGTLLLSFKYSILSDPLSVLESWNYNDTTPCSWSGITCGKVGTDSPDIFQVTSLVLPNSKLLGSIPEELGLIQHLKTLDLSKNFMNGTLPSSLFNSSELQVLSLSNNVISGELPKFISGSSSLQVLNLSDNAFAGKVPKSLASLKNLTVVSLRSNYFSGSIPSGFQSVEVLDLSSNMFNESLPLEFGGEDLHYLNLSYNKISGPIPLDFVKKIPRNVSIDLSFNKLTGQIPESLAFSNQKIEPFLGNADLCGKPLIKICSVPSTLSTAPNLNKNNSAAAIAAIPIEINSSPSANQNQDRANHGLKPGTIAAIIVADLGGLGILIMILLYVYQLKKKKQNVITNANYQKKAPAPAYTTSVTGAGTSFEISKFAKCGEWSCTSLTASEDISGSESEDHKKLSDINVQMKKSLVIVDGETKLETETLLKASAYILGSSGGSIVYKAVLEDGMTFAVRRIGESGVERLKEFENQVKVIAKLRHPNLVKVRGFYWGEDEKLLIYDYISNGSLATAERFASSPLRLPFQVRLNIAKGIARGLAHVHEKKHVHGNIKPSNILLTRDMEPIISDLGLHWLISGKNNYKTDCSTRHFGSKRCTSSNECIPDRPTCSSPHIEPTGFMGCTSPYHAPESLKSLKPNPKWDVYSYGIVLLELLTGKVFSDRELGQWTGGLYEKEKSKVLMMVDVAIRDEIGARGDDMWTFVKLGFSCASLVPQKRPCMKDVVQVLEKIMPAKE